MTEIDKVQAEEVLEAIEHELFGDLTEAYLRRSAGDQKRIVAYGESWASSTSPTHQKLMAWLGVRMELRFTRGETINVADHYLPMRDAAQSLSSLDSIETQD